MTVVPEFLDHPSGVEVVFPDRRGSGVPQDAAGVAYWTALLLAAGCDTAGCSVEQVLRPLSRELTRMRPDLFPPMPRRDPAPSPAVVHRAPWWRRRICGEAVLSWLGVAATAALVVVIVAGGLLGWWG